MSLLTGDFSRRIFNGSVELLASIDLWITRMKEACKLIKS